ncbi:universal stress protein [Sulfobacillus harzensis]|uniref:Universal stress protein n=1 Tax=Sulfobacillus harzensis TaxID=2729629 RepID=A0A7Y0L628_9FIRM|nr:universal stress protein [Sulfobacillus harzensis]
MQRILLALDGRGHAEAACRWVRRWLLADDAIEVTVLYVTELAGSARFAGPRWTSDYERDIQETLRAYLEQDVFRGVMDRVRFLHESGTSVSDVIVMVADILHCHTIVLGGQPPRGFRRWVGGGVAAGVLRRTGASVMVVRSHVERVLPTPMHGPHRAG